MALTDLSLEHDLDALTHRAAEALRDTYIDEALKQAFAQ